MGRSPDLVTQLKDENIALSLMARNLVEMVEGKERFKYPCPAYQSNLNRHSTKRAALQFKTPMQGQK